MVTFTGWEYRHWDAMLLLLADASLKYYTNKGVRATTVARDVFVDVQEGWESVFHSEKHELVEIWAEGKHLVALKLLLTSASKILKLNIEAENAATSLSSRIELKDASFNIVKIMVRFIYIGKVEPQLMVQRGIDIFLASHKYGVESLKALCEAEIVATQENWIKLLSAATDCDSEILAVKCADSIKRTMELRQENTTFFKRSFSESLDAPGQLFHGPGNSSS
ncbi:hypothetical protein O6H91_06G062100 [Diphasiastrum complanatum]|uniref:Uncharacterized protein n=1 Tax=Diphasiastrum complanatum TaxID=34168 RepID=A0ACC2DET1_DIPCM|nr:hypothetical protein O6H91_06G062100 [Diphasiastrum complanatum]